MCVLRAHAEKMAQLQAEESMGRSTEVSQGRGLKPSPETWRRWGRLADGPRRASRTPANPGALSAIGIGFRKVKKNG